MKFKVEVEWSGYCRGISEYIIEADSKEEAGELYFEGEITSHDVVRDDTEKDVLSITEI